jgi:hypothetical protein
LYLLKTSKNPALDMGGAFIESATTRRAGGLDFSAIGGKKQRHDSALIGASVTVQRFNCGNVRAYNRSTV